MPQWAVLVLAVGIWPLLLVFMVYFVMRLNASSMNTGRESVDFPSLAQERALELLREVLDEREYEQVKRRGYLDIRSPSDPQRIYRIGRHGGLVRVFEQGRAVRELCVQPTEPLPSNDVVVMHKLMIQANEQEYLTKANQFSLVFPLRASAHDRNAIW